MTQKEYLKELNGVSRSLGNKKVKIEFIPGKHSNAEQTYFSVSFPSNKV